MHILWSKAPASVFFSLYLVFLYSLLSAEAAYAKEEALGSQAVHGYSWEISPENVRALDNAGVPYILIQADGAESIPDADTSIRRIYYTTDPSFRAAQEQVSRLRNNYPPSSADSGHPPSQRLVGTPLDWHRLGLKFSRSPLPDQPLSLSPKLLAEALKDDADLQLVDLRPEPQSGSASSFPQAVRMMPHQIENGRAMLSKHRWLILIDDDGTTAPFIAEHLFRQGYLLTAVLEGGYAAWVKSTDR